VAPKTSVEQLYGEAWADTSRLDGELERSLEPRGTEWLFDLFADLGPRPGQLLVDVGARDAKHAIRLANEHGLRAIAIDPVARHVQLARRAVADAGVDVDVLEAGIESMPIDAEVADWIWCRDVLVHIDLERGFAECARILRPGGQLLAYVTCSTDTLEPGEAETLFGAIAVVPESTQPENIERRAAGAGLTLVSKTALAGEWRERMIEDGSWDPKDDLLRLSRLQRRSKELEERYGATALAAYAAGSTWGIYQLLGKLRPTIYLWRRDA
jgi:SAM-dependent methyltransferase